MRLNRTRFSRLRALFPPPVSHNVIRSHRFSDYVRATPHPYRHPGRRRPLAALAERTFRDTFADDNSTDDMDAYVRDSFSLDRVRADWLTT